MRPRAQASPVCRSHLENAVVVGVRDGRHAGRGDVDELGLDLSTVNLLGT